MIRTDLASNKNGLKNFVTICTDSIFILILQLFAEYFEIQTLSRLRLWIVSFQFITQAGLFLYIFTSIPCVCSHSFNSGTVKKWSSN